MVTNNACNAGRTASAQCYTEDSPSWTSNQLYFVLFIRKKYYFCKKYSWPRLELSGSVLDDSNHHKPCLGSSPNHSQAAEVLPSPPELGERSDLWLDCPKSQQIPRQSPKFAQIEICKIMKNINFWSKKVFAIFYFSTKRIVLGAF